MISKSRARGQGEASEVTHAVNQKRTIFLSGRSLLCLFSVRIVTDIATISLSSYCFSTGWQHGDLCWQSHVFDTLETNNL